MGRPKGSLSKIPKIQYPRKCEDCDYISNNPQMYHYHKRIHESPLTGIMCYFGCGNQSTFRSTRGKYTCVKRYCDCPAYLTQLSVRTENSWDGDETRKEKTKETFLTYCAGQPGPTAKMRKTRLEKSNLLDPAIAKEYRVYARRLRRKAQHWAKSQGYVLGRQTFHVDHKLSVLDCWNFGLSIQIANHPHNLEVLPAKVNSGKGPKSSQTLQELLTKIFSTQPVVQA